MGNAFRAALDQTACIATTFCVFLDCVFIIDFHRCLSPAGIYRVAITVLHVMITVCLSVHDTQIHGFNPWFVYIDMNACMNADVKPRHFSMLSFMRGHKGDFTC